MQQQKTILTGQVLQCRDKLLARRHSVPETLQSDWESLIHEANKLNPQINRETRTKWVDYKGDEESLKDLLNQLQNFAQSLPH